MSTEPPRYHADSRGPAAAVSRTAPTLSNASLPTESELCEEFGASRYTVREALRRLVDQGMVHRRQGAGSVASPPRPRRATSIRCPRWRISSSSRSTRISRCSREAGRAAAGAGARRRRRNGLAVVPVKGLAATEPGGSGRLLHSLLHSRHRLEALRIGNCPAASARSTPISPIALARTSWKQTRRFAARS